MNELSDFTSQRIEGITREQGLEFSVPLFSQIDGNLWMGGCPVKQAPEYFKFIISLYPWGMYNHADHQVYTEATLFDSNAIPNKDTLDALVAHINTCRKLGPTLVHCQAGLNRSGLLTAMALVAEGMAPRAAIKLLREKRCDAVLCNRSFVSMLTGEP